MIDDDDETLDQATQRRQRERTAKRNLQRTAAGSQTSHEPKPNGHATPRFKLLGLDDLDLSADEDWIIDEVLPRQGVGVLYGRHKAFKSFAALDMAWAVADTQRREWGGRRLMRHGVVVYIVCEGQRGMRKRLLAYKQRHGDNELPALLRIEGKPNLGRPLANGVPDIVASVRHVLPAEEIALVIIDTVRRTLFNDETNDTLAAFLDNCAAISDQLNCLVLAVHHEGVDGSRPRGGTTLPAAVDVLLHIKRQRGQKSCQLFVEEAKDSESDFGFTIALQSHEFGDEHSERRDSTLIVEEVKPLAVVAGSEEQPKRKRLKPPPTMGAFMTATEVALDRHGILVSPFNDGPTVKAVRIELLRTTYYQQRSDLEEQSKRTVFARQLSDAVARELVVTRDIHGQPMIWLPRPNH